MENPFLPMPEIIPDQPVNGVCRRFITDVEFIELEHQLSVANKRINYSPPLILPSYC
jgi:hypothetical protein